MKQKTRIVEYNENNHSSIKTMNLKNRGLVT